MKACRDCLDQEGYLEVTAPILTPAACEGTTTLFETEYFDLGKAYLTQSGQLYSEATAAAFGKVYCFGPTFRAEKSKTRRHLTEFWMVEPEAAFATLDDMMALAERFISFIVKRVLERRRTELVTLGRDTSKLEKIEPPFPRISYDEAVEILKRKEASSSGAETSEARMKPSSARTSKNPSWSTAFPPRSKRSIWSRTRSARNWRSGWTSSRRGLRRDHRRRPAHERLQPPA